MTAPSSVTNFERTFSKNGRESPTKSKAESDTSSENSSETPRAVVELDLTQDAQLDTTPFPRTHAPFQLASLVDPKDIEKLTDLGGTTGVLEALGTDSDRGLTTEGRSRSHGAVGLQDDGLVKSDTAAIEKEFSNEKGKDKDASAVHGTAGSEGDDHHDRSSSYFATIEDRQRVYGKNIVPTKKSKSLLMLMWIALQDKVLVSRWCSYSL
jgi:Ca2+-transporting ATPase